LFDSNVKLFHEIILHNSITRIIRIGDDFDAIYGFDFDRVLSESRAS
jgi:hypothetical protein